MELGNKYEGGGCFAITVTEIGRTGEMGKLLYTFTWPTVEPTTSTTVRSSGIRYI